MCAILPLVLFVFPDEKAEVAMAVLPFLLQAKAGACQHKDFVEFISVSITKSEIKSWICFKC